MPFLPFYLKHLKKPLSRLGDHWLVGPSALELYAPKAPPAFQGEGVAFHEVALPTGGPAPDEAFFGGLRERVPGLIGTLRAPDGAPFGWATDPQGRETQGFAEIRLRPHLEPPKYGNRRGVIAVHPTVLADDLARLHAETGSADALEALAALLRSYPQHFEGHRCFALPGAPGAETAAPPAAAKTPRPFRPARHQLAVYAEVAELLHDHEASVLRPPSPLQPRYNPLLIAASGTGKTTLARALAADAGYHCYRITAGSWAIQNGPQKPSLALIYPRLVRYPRVLLHFDELEKLFPQGLQENHYVASTAAEIFQLLDREIAPEAYEAAFRDADVRPPLEDLQTALHQRVFIFGTATFQSLWARLDEEQKAQERASRLCFALPQVPPHPDPEAIRSAVPEELLNRFHTQPLFMPPLGLADYARMAQDALDWDWLAPEDRAAFQSLITDGRIREAYQTRKGVRFLEELAAAAQRQTRRSQPSHHPPLTAARTA